MTLRLSVIIATCHRPAVLCRTLECLTPDRQQLPPDAFEVIVADDSRDDATQHIVAQRFPHALHVRGPGRGPASNRNRGAAHARGEWLIFLDDDCVPQPEWLTALAREARTGTVDVIEGSIQALEKGDSVFRHAVENVTGDLFWTGNLSIRREVFDRLGRFDEDFLEPCFEDLEFADRIRRGGLRTRFCPGAVVLHPCQSVTLRFLFKRTLRMRWHLLYLHKTGQAVSPHEPAWKALAYLSWRRVRGLVSMVRRLRRLYPGRPRTALVDLATECLTFPFVLPYLMYWELQFRELLLSDRRRTGRS